MKWFVFLCFVLYIFGANAGTDFVIDPCHWDDADCIMASAQKLMPFLMQGDPSRGLFPLDPLFVDNLNGDNGDLKLQFNNVTIKGLSRCEIIKVLRPEKLKVYLEIDSPIIATGQYVLDGKFFFLELFGNDHFEINTEKIKFKVTAHLEEFKKDSKDYYKVGKFTYEFEPIEIFHFNFKNLYNGDEAKAEPVLEILKNSWKETITDFGRPVIDKVIHKVAKDISNVFRLLSITEIQLS